MINKEQIEVFFFGSPAEGFTSYPSKYSKLVNGLDKSSSKYKLECKHIVSSAKSKIQYAEYGLTGVGQHGKSRGGRNFGIWIEIPNYKINEIGQSKILSYIEEFINNGIVENSNIFKVTNSKSKHFLIHSFSDVSSKLDKLIDVFKEHFIVDFNAYFEPINSIDNFVIDLNPVIIEEPKKQKKTISFANQNEDTLEKEITSNVTKNEKRKSGKSIFSFSKLNTILLILIILLTFFNGSIDENDDLTKYKLEIKELNNKIDNLENKLSESKNKALNTNSEGNNKKDRSYIVKKGENLKKIVIDYNAKNGTEFSTEEIAKFNEITDISKIDIGQKIKFPN